MLSTTDYQQYAQILKEELIPAQGCTEPAAIAYAAASAARRLGARPDAVAIEVSGSIIKNAKSVIVPNTGGLRGIEAAASAGIVAGDPDKSLRVIAGVTAKDVEAIHQFMREVPISVRHAKGGAVFDILVTVRAGARTVSVRVSGHHTNIAEIRENGETVGRLTGRAVQRELTDRSFMTVEGIVEFARVMETSDVKDVLDEQIACNTAICDEGLRGNYGANIGKVLLRAYGDGDVKIRARARAAAGSDARMNGCELPVVINSGSGNQGITASVPVIEYAETLGVSSDTLYRALAVSNLVTIHIKTGIGRLSAYCGVVCAGCGCGAAIAYLNGGGYDEIAHTIVNALAVTSGIICDGAKASCAAKIATAVDAGILGYQMYMDGQQFLGGDGIIKKGVENTIKNVCCLARNGMCETEREILRIMMDAPDEAQQL
ncbi:MAG: L-serine ammonia-lyase, iron-sulfur-dependent, subunit alpha [Clostridiales bacterium]|jgi:L-cysteine desulfidase|nr:L-serine ammonia-lyase, iron-sulfur-dependent, subunit alpha [Clostridiales bacterium]